MDKKKTALLCLALLAGTAAHAQNVFGTNIFSKVIPFLLESVKYVLQGASIICVGGFAVNLGRIFFGTDDERRSDKLFRTVLAFIAAAVILYFISTLI